MAQHMSHYEFLLYIMKMEEISVGTDFSDEMDYPRPLFGRERGGIAEKKRTESIHG